MANASSTPSSSSTPMGASNRKKGQGTWDRGQGIRDKAPSLVPCPFSHVPCPVSRVPVGMYALVCERIRHVQAARNAERAGDVRCATGVGERTPVARGVVLAEQVLEPHVDPVAPLCVEEISAGEVDHAVIAAGDLAET